MTVTSRTAAHGANRGDWIGLRAAVAVAVLALVSGWLVFKYVSGINLMTEAPCSAGTQAALVGIGAATAAVTAAVLRLATALTSRRDSRSQRLSLAWTICAAVIVGVAGYCAYVITFTENGVLVPAACHL